MSERSNLPVAEIPKASKFYRGETTVRAKIGSALDVELLGALKDGSRVTLEGHEGKLWVVTSRNVILPAKSPEATFTLAWANAGADA